MMSASLRKRISVPQTIRYCMIMVFILNAIVKFAGLKPSWVLVFYML